jgi:hypothetical protein
LAKWGKNEAVIGGGHKNVKKKKLTVTGVNKGNRGFSLGKY